MSHPESGQQTTAGMYLPAYWPMYAYGQTHPGVFYYPPQLYPQYSLPSHQISASSHPSRPDAIVSAPTPIEPSVLPVSSLSKRRVPVNHFGFTRDKTRWALIRHPSIPLFAGGGDFRVLGLSNPSFICYFNSILQVLLPFTAFSFEYFARHHDSGPWHSLLHRLFLHFSPLPSLAAVLPPPPPPPGPPSRRHPSGALSKGACVLEICRDLSDLLARDVGPVGEQHDVGEALMLLLEKLHGERSWGSNSGGDSVVYRIFRGVTSVTEHLRSGERRMTEEMFLTLTLAPTGRKQNLVDLLKSNFHQNNRKIKKLPPVLCVELSRHHIENKDTASQAVVAFPEFLEIPLVCLTTISDLSQAYELYGVVLRSGLYSNSGHYWVAQRSHQTGCWGHWINDESITKISNFDQIVNDAASNWSLLLYAQPDACISFTPSSS